MVEYTLQIVADYRIGGDRGDRIAGGEKGRRQVVHCKGWWTTAS